MWRSRLFWRFFFSIMAVVLVTSLVSVQFERYVAERYSPRRIHQTVSELIAFRDSLTEALADDDIELAHELLVEDSDKSRQFLVFDEYDNEILGREKLLMKRFEKPFAHPLTRAFQDRHQPIFSAVDSLSGQTYYIQIQPQLAFRPWFSPRFAGTVLRVVLLLFLSAVVCYVLTRTLTRRIHLLQLATHELAQHQTTSSERLNQLGNDELGALGRDFHHMAAQLSASENARKQMLSDISHELRSPLARLQVAIEIARERLLKGDDTRAQLDRMETEAERMNALIGQIIHIQRLTLDNDSPCWVETDLVELLHSLIADVNYEYQQDNKHAVLTTHEPRVTFACEAELRSALENILRNAMSHTPADTQVMVKLSQKKQRIVVMVSDCGEGIGDADSEKIFQPFVRLDNSRHRQTGGYGLGLAIAKAVIERHGGEIQAKNQTPEADNAGVSGLSVCVYLPCKPPL